MLRGRPTAWIGVSALLSLVFASLIVVSPVAAQGPVVVYDSIPDPLGYSEVSLGYQATSTDEMGDDVRLAGTARDADKVRVAMVTWAPRAPYDTPNPVFPGSDETGWDHDITLNIYRTDTVAGVPTPGALIATKTQTFRIPWRPEADVTCATPTAWRAADTNCYNGFAFTIEFDLSADDVTLPGRIVVSVAFDTNTHGAAPIGAPGPYESLNVGLGSAPTVGTDVDADAIMWDTSHGPFYDDAGLGGTDTLRHDPNWTPYVPAFQITATEGTASTVVVKDADLDGWAFFDENTSGGTPGAFRDGPDTPPLGTGSAAFVTSAANQGKALGRLGDPGTRLDDITEISYSTYRASLDAGDNLAVALSFNVDFDLLDLNTGWQGRLTFEPYQTYGGTIVEDTWQTWDALDGEWWVSSPGAASPASTCGQPTPCTWIEFLAQHPNAGIHATPTLGGVVFKAGSGWATFDGAVDALTLGIDGDSTTWDFEFTPQCTTDCYVSPAGDNANGGTSFSDAKLTIQAGINAVDANGTVHVAAGNYVEDVSLNKAGVTLLGDGIGSSIISGPIGGTDGATVRIAAADVAIDGFTITREGNNATDWNDPTLNSAGVAVQGQTVSGEVRNSRITGNRSGVDVNNSNGNTFRNNVIDNNHTGMIFRNQTDDTVVSENSISDNRTVGILFLDASSGSNAPLQQALNSDFSGNAIAGNWYGQVVDRQQGGSLPTPGTTNLKDFSGNWLGTTSPVVTTANSAEPGYAVLIPPAFGGAATAPGGQPDVAGPGSANLDITPVLAVGTDTDLVTLGFQGSTTALHVIPDGKSAQTGSENRIQEAIDIVPAGTGSVTLNDGTIAIAATVDVDKDLTLQGESEAFAIVNADAISGSYGIHVTADDVSITDLTLDGPSGTVGAYGLKADSVSGLLLENVTVQGSGRSGIDLHDVSSSQLTSVTVADNAANGLAITDSDGITLTDLTATNNAPTTPGFGQVAIYASGTYVAAGVDDITFAGSYTYTLPVANPVPLFTDHLTNTAADITDIDVSATDLDHVVRSSTFPTVTWYQATKDGAVAFAEGVNAFTTTTGAGVSPEADRNLFLVDGALRIQAAIDLSVSNDTVDVYPGSYAETAVGRGTVDDTGPHQFGLFFPPSKPGLLVRGVAENGDPITSAGDVAAFVTTNATNTFGYAGTFVSADDVTIRGLSFGANTAGENKTIEVIGDGFTLDASELTAGGAFYMGDFRYDDNGTLANFADDTAHIQSYTLTDNTFAGGSTPYIANGAGATGPRSGRVITGNTISSDQPLSFAGPTPTLGWLLYPVGGAIIENNDFTNASATRYVQAWGSEQLTGQFDWSDIFTLNDFVHPVITTTDGDADNLRPYTVGNFIDIHRVGAQLQDRINNAQDGDVVLAGAGTFPEQVNANNDDVTIRGAADGKGASIVDDGAGKTGTGIAITASDVTIEDLTVQNYDLGITITSGPISDITLTDVKSVDNDRHGVWSQAFDLTGLTIDGGQYSRNNEAGGKSGRGIWIINGDKVDITITGVQAVDNGLVGIDLSDGTATGVTITGNTVTGNGDAGIGVLGATGPGANLISDNIVTDNGRFGIEIKNPDGNGAQTGGGSVVVVENTVSRTEAATDARDHVGIVVMRRDPVGGVNVDQPTGVVVKDNTVTGFVRKVVAPTGDGFGIVVEGTGHLVTGNSVSGNDIGIQAQAANPAINTQGTDWFDRGNASSYSGTISRNSIAGNVDLGFRAVGLASAADVTCNWWGAANGPGPVGTGSGDEISTNATFAPFLITSSLSGDCVATAVDTAADDDTDTEGATLTASGSFTGNDLTLSVDDNGLGGTFTPNDAAGTWTYELVTTNDIAATVVTVTAESDNGTSADDAFTFEASNVAPTATWTAPTTADEAVGFDISLTAPVDPSSDDLAGLTYAFDCGDGAGYSTPATTPTTVTCTIPDGPDSVTVKGKVLDDDTETESTQVVTIANTDPTGTFTITSTPVDEGTSFTLAITGGTDVAADQATLTYEFDCGEGYAAASATSSAVCTTSDDGPATLDVKGRITDKDGGSTEYTDQVSVTNIDPTATFTAPASADEGATFQVSLSDVVDPGAETFTYAFDCGDGMGYGTASATDTATCSIDDGDDTVTVKGTVFDDDGGSTEYTDTVDIDNVAPTGTFTAPGAASEGSTFGLAISGGTDASSADAADLEYQFDCGDGAGYGAASATASVSCEAIDGGGSQSVKGKVIDPDGAFTEYTDTVATVNLNPTANFVAPNSVASGALFTIRLNGGDDASQVDRDNLTYAFDCGSGFGAAGASNEAECTAPASGSVLVRGRVYDPDGGSTLYTDTVQVNESDAVLDPTAHDFGDTKVGAGKTFTFDLDNDGGAPLTVSDVTISGANAGQFSVDGSDCTAGSIPANGSCEIEVTFSPTSVGGKVGVLEVISDAPGSPTTADLTGTGALPDASMAPASHGFGDQIVDTTSAAVTFTVDNDGPVPLVISAVSLGGTNPGQFDITLDDCTGSVGANDSCIVRVAFAPTNATPDAKSATLTVATDDPDALTLTATLTGTAKTRTLAILPANEDFGDVSINKTSSPTTFTVTNTGTSNATISEVRFAGSNPGHFAVDTDGCEGVTLAPTQTCDVEVVFAPFNTGNKTARLSIVSNATNSPVQADLEGRGVVADADLSPGAHDFGSVLIGESSPFEFTLSNDGTGPMTVQAVSLSGSNTGQFDISDDQCDGEVLDPNESCTIEVSFEPTSGGAKTARLVVTSDAPGSPHRSDLSGSGVSEATGGTLTIVLDALPDAGQDFAYTATGSIPNFSLDDDGNATLPKQRIFTDLDGTFTITQNDPALWKLTAISCTPSQTVNKGARTATVTVSSGNNVICTFTNVLRRPDVQISKAARSGPYKGADIYSSTPISNQTESRKGIPANATYRYWVRLQNDSLAPDKFKLAATESGAAGITVVYRIDGVDKSAPIKAGTFKTAQRAPNATMVIEIFVTVPAGTPLGAGKTVLLTATSNTDAASVDVVRAITRR